MNDDNDYYDDDRYRSHSWLKWMKIRSHPSEHIPNSDESAVLRRLKAETGLSEAEIRSKIKYRRMLAAAQKKGRVGKRTKQQKFCDKLVTKACRLTKLAKEHPKTIEALQKIIDTLPEPGTWSYTWECRGIDPKFVQTLNAKKLVEG